MGSRDPSKRDPGLNQARARAIDDSSAVLSAEVLDIGGGAVRIRPLRSKLHPLT